MNHDDARRAISERMDGERLSGHATAALERHLARCGACRSFEAGAWRLREAARFGVAEAVPDLVSRIMTAVELEATDRPRRLRVRPVRPAPRGSWSGRLAPVAAALVIGLVAGSLTVGGPWQNEHRARLASAADISAGIAAAASELDAYQARFAITEQDPTGAVGVRRLSMNLWFRAPERYRLDVTDDTAFASRSIVPNDLQLIVNGDASYTMAPSACPVGVCPRDEMVVRNRLPYSSTTPAPTDLILPVTTLVDAHEMQVVRRGRMLGRDAIEVRLPFERARPLFPFLDLGGSWRPMFPGDRVDLWLDARNWFPLRYTVYPAGSRVRDEWELRFGLPDESPRDQILEVRALSIDETPPPLSVFRIPRNVSARDEGARPVPIDRVDRAVDFAAPTQVEGLSLYSVVRPDGSDDEAVVTYARGLSWVKLGETHAWTGDGFFGPIGVHAQEIDVAGLGTAYYEPATDRHGRRLAIHTEAAGDLYLETNLSREELLRVAASLRMSGTPVPRSWLAGSSALGRTTRVSIEQAATATPFSILLPAAPPDGYALASAELVTVAGRTGLNVYFQREDADFGAGPLQLHEEEATRLPPASAARQFEVRVRGVVGRWMPGWHQLEWIEGGVYYSLDARTLGLQDLLAVAASMRPLEPPPSPSPSVQPPTWTPTPQPAAP